MTLIPQEEEIDGGRRQGNDWQCDYSPRLDSTWQWSDDGGF